MDSCLSYRVTLVGSSTFRTRLHRSWIIRKTTGTDRRSSKWSIRKTSRKFASSSQRKNLRTPVEFWIWKLAPSRRRVISRRCAFAWDRDAASFAAWKSATWTPRIWLSVTWIDWNNETHWDHRATVRTLPLCTALATLRIGLQPVSVAKLIRYYIVFVFILILPTRDQPNFMCDT